MSVTGNAILDGLVCILLFGDFDPQIGDTFYILAANTITDNGVSYEFPSLEEGFFTAEIVNTNSQSLRLSIVPEPHSVLLLLAGAALLLCLLPHNRWTPKGRAEADSIAS